MTRGILSSLLTRRKRLGASPLVDLSEYFQGYDPPLAVGVDLSRSIYAAASKSGEELYEEKRIGQFPKSKRAEGAEFKVVRVGHDGSVRTLVSRDDTVFSYVQPLGDRVLLIGARCHWRPEGAERNALVLNWDGSEHARFTLGDGIADVRTPNDGQSIWVSYFDEGVFGNYGWSHPGPQAIGAAGLVQFSPEGDVVKQYDAAAAGTDDICDAYATNLVGDDECWVYFYTEFPFVRVTRSGYTVWTDAPAGASAMAIREGREALLFGDYKTKNLARKVSLGDSSVTSVDEMLVEDDLGNPMSDALCFGVGARLYFVKDRRVLVLDEW